MKQGKLFRIDWGSYEDSNYELFTHPTKTKTQFDKDIKKIIELYRLSFINGTPKEGYIGCDDLANVITDGLLEMGYTNPEIIELQVGYQGIINEKKSFANPNDQYEEKKLCGEDLFDRIVAHNKALSAFHHNL
jgi:hypothetical protein